MLSGKRCEQIAKEILFGDGYVVLKKFFDPAPVANKLSPVVDAHKDNDGGVVSGGYRPDIGFSHGLEELMAEPSLLDVAFRVLGDVPAYGSFGCNVVPPGSDGMSVHIDYPYFAMTKLPSGPSPALCMQLIWYVDDVTSDSGPTIVVPGSQTKPRLPKKSAKAKAILAKAGDLFVGHGALWHGVAPHAGKKDRPVLLGSYVPFWVQPMLLGYQPPGASTELRELLRSNMGERIGRAYERTSA